AEITDVLQLHQAIVEFLRDRLAPYRLAELEELGGEFRGRVRSGRFTPGDRAMPFVHGAVLHHDAHSDRLLRGVARGEGFVFLEIDALRQSLHGRIRDRVLVETLQTGTSVAE